MPTRLLLSLMLAAPLAALAACGDDVTDPHGLLDSAEAEAVMRSAEALPLLPELMEHVDGDVASATSVRARELWDAGTAVDDPRGAARRRRAISYALPLLTPAVPPAEWDDARARIDEWMTTAEAMLRHIALPAVQARLDAAAHQLDQADAAESDRSRAYHLLLASSELVETTPRFVARTLAREADAAVDRAAQRQGEVPDAALDRATRLRDWSAQAVQEGDYLRAIQRAYYAIQLVEPEAR